ncbi:hypothetical protein SPONN_2550 [uncultured Candidatus Thioglobus sp.]|nr:hypothetical protein SPONN_2550 [uncultured Candidatus Thioglobus sp.]
MVAEAVSGSEASGIALVCAELSFGVIVENVTLTFQTVETGTGE